MKGIVGSYYQFSVWITRFAYVNLLWIIFTIVGLGVFGLIPATAAMFAVIRKWVLKEEDIPVFKTFWKYFRRDFMKINLLGYMILLIGYALFIEFQILWGSHHIANIVASFGVIALFVLYIIVLIYFFPIFVHFNLKSREYFKWPFVIGMIHPILTIFLIVSLSLIHYFIFITIPALLFFFGGSITAYVITWGVSKTFSKYERIGAEST